jgi:hypothetical protein
VRHNRLVCEHHGEHVELCGLCQPKQGQERFREYASFEPVAKRSTLTPTDAGLGSHK